MLLWSSHKSFTSHTEELQENPEDERIQWMNYSRLKSKHSRLAGDEEVAKCVGLKLKTSPTPQQGFWRKMEVCPLLEVQCIMTTSMLWCRTHACLQVKGVISKRDVRADNSPRRVFIFYFEVKPFRFFSTSLLL